MIKLTSALKTAAATTKPGEKMAAIKGLDSDNQRLLMLAQNTFITFGVKKIPSYLCKLEVSPKAEDLTRFFEMADRLSLRLITGSMALDIIGRCLSSYSLETAQTLEKVLKKDLRASLGTTLINKVYKKLIPVFKCMLAAKMPDNFDWEAGPWLVEYKYDGMRILAHVTEDGIEYYSRSGLAQPKFRGVFDDCLFELREQTEIDFWVDGEVLAPTFQETMNARKSDADTSNLIFRAFDLVYADEWAAQESKIGNLERRENLHWLLGDGKGGNVELSEGIICETRKEVEDFYQNLLAAGAEGVIIKDRNAPYYWKRNKAWTKYKPVWTADLTLLGMYEGTGKYKGMLGGFQLKGELEDGTVVRADCGSGFDDAARKEFWDNQKKYVGKTIEVEYQEVSKAQKSDTFSLRFPVYKCVRIDK